MPNSERPADFDAIIDELVGQGQFGSIEDLNRELSRHMHTYNRHPQAELGGLSPDAMSQLLYGDWLTRGTLRVTEHVTADELAGSAAYADLRTILEYVAENAPVRETPARNFTRATVAALLPRLRLYAGQKGDENGFPPPKNEGDVYWLTALRFTAITAGLLVRRRGLRVTKRANQLLADSRAGELYALLFRTLFGRVDLRALDASDRHAGLQTTIPYSFFRLGTCAREWAPEDELAESAWLASAKEAPSESDMLYVDTRHYSFQNRVLIPLTHFGLSGVLSSVPLDAMRYLTGGKNSLP